MSSVPLLSTLTPSIIEGLQVTTMAKPVQEFKFLFSSYSWGFSLPLYQAGMIIPWSRAQSPLVVPVSFFEWPPGAQRVGIEWGWHFRVVCPPQKWSAGLIRHCSPGSGLIKGAVRTGRSCDFWSSVASRKAGSPFGSINLEALFGGGVCSSHGSQALRPCSDVGISPDGCRYLTPELQPKVFCSFSNIQKASAFPLDNFLCDESHMRSLDYSGSSREKYLPC